MCLAELGPLYDWPNKSVIPAVENAAPHLIWGDFGIGRQVVSFTAAAAARPLPPHPSGAIMN
jgi:hypothetical protein